MVKYILAIIFFIFALFGCNSGGGDVVNGGSANGDISGGRLYNPNVGGIANISSGGADIKPYYDSGYYTLVYRIPADREKSVSVNYNLSAMGYSSYFNAQKMQTDSSSEAPVSLHQYLREREVELLAKGFSQTAPMMRKASSVISVGDTWEGVNVSRDASSNNTVINASCIGISNYAYFFLEEGLPAPSSRNLQRIMTAFDGIYPIMHDKFGRENDVDGNGKIIILLYRTTVSGLYGYFSSADKYSVAEVSDSNEADMFYVNYSLLGNRFNDVMATLAHEFQHMILFDNRYNQNLRELDIWINEGLSMQAEYYTGYYDKQSSDYIGRFLDYHYNVSLTNWDYSSVLNYSASLLYIRYLAERFGDDVIKRLYTASDSGILAVESATGVDFDEIFKDFVMAVFISGRGISTVPKYNFKTIDIRTKGGLAAFSTLDVGRNVTFPILPYSMQLIRWNGVVTKISISDSVEAYGAPIFD